jgi:hypothetical protein
VHLLKGFAFRRNPATAYPAYTYTVTIKIGDAATPAAGISMTYTNNWRSGGQQTTVFNGQISFPATPVVPRPPAPATDAVPFQTPHPSLGMHPLLWELYITSTAPQAKTFHERGQTSSNFTAGVLGQGCTVTGGTAPMGSSGSINATTMTDTLINGPANAVSLLLLGNTSDKFLGTIPLPFDLSGIGSAGCYLNINFLLQFPMTTNGSGGATFTLPYTNNPSLAGTRLRTQWGAIDSASTFRTSNGLDHAIPYNGSGIPWPQNSVYNSNFGASPPATAYANYISGCVTTWML